MICEWSCDQNISSVKIRIDANIPQFINFLAAV